MRHFAQLLPGKPLLPLVFLDSAFEFFRVSKKKEMKEEEKVETFFCFLLSFISSANPCYLVFIFVGSKLSNFLGFL